MDLAKKLQIRPETRIQLVNAPKELRDAFDPLPEGATLISRGKPPFDGTVVLCKGSADVTRYALPAAGDIVEDGLLWFCFPKGTSGISTNISRDRGWEAFRPLGLRPVRSISIDDTWSAVRWRPVIAVKRRAT